MVDSTVELVLDGKNKLGEGPVWSATEGVLYWVDIQNNCFYRYDPVSGDHQRYDVGMTIGTVVVRESGGFALALADGLYFYDGTSGEKTLIAAPERDKPGSRFNDGAVDRQGRLWAGTCGDGDGALYRLDTDLSLHKMETRIFISNGIGWSPDNRTMYYTDSTPRAIWAYDFDQETGSIANRRVFATIDDGDAVPDGLTVDSDGYVWSCHWDGWKIRRYAPDGSVERDIPVPVQRPTSVMFGGANLDELYITSARSDFTDEQLKDQPHAGGLFRLKTHVQGMVEPAFRG